MAGYGRLVAYARMLKPCIGHVVFIFEYPLTLAKVAVRCANTTTTTTTSTIMDRDNCALQIFI